MPIRRTRRRRSRLQIGPTSRTRDSVWFLFPCRDFDPAANLSKLIPTTHFRYLGQPTSTTSERNASVGPKKMFEPNIVQPSFCFLASGATGCDELVVDRNG